MELTLTPLSANQWPTDILPDTDPLSGVVTITARPARHAWVVGQTILKALGVRPDVVGTGRRRDEDEELVVAWFRAYAVSLLVVRDADTYLTTKERTYLFNLAERAGCDLALACHEGAGEGLMKWVTAHGGSINPDMAYLSDYLSRQRCVVRRPEDEEGRMFPAFLPQADFYLFRARARDLLPTDEFEIVDAHYREVFQEVRDHPFQTGHDACDYLLHRGAIHASPAAALVTVRAAQAAMFTAGKLLKVDLPFLLAAAEQDELRRLNRNELWSMRAYRLPWRACAIVLRDAGLSRAETTSLRIDDLDFVGQPRHIGERLAPESCVFMRAQRELRRIQGATREDPLIPVPDRALAKALRDSAAELGIPLIRVEEPRGSGRKSRLKDGLRASLLSLDSSRFHRNGGDA